MGMIKITKEEIENAAIRYDIQNMRAGGKKDAFMAGVEWVLKKLKESEEQK